jgi:hypothetical protein
LLQAAVVRSEDVANMDPLLEVLLNMLNAGAWVYFGYLSTPVDNYIGVSISANSPYLVLAS